MDKKVLFRKKSYEHINSPEKLDQYLDIPGAKTWTLIVALFIILIVIIIWGIFGTVPQTVSGIGIRTGRGVTCFVASQEAYRIKSGMQVIINDDKNSIVGEVDLVGMSVTYDNAGAAVNAPWLLENNIKDSDWVTPVIIKVDEADEELITRDAELDAKIVVEEQAPYKILFE